MLVGRVDVPILADVFVLEISQSHDNADLGIRSRHLRVRYLAEAIRPVEVVLRTAKTGRLERPHPEVPARIVPGEAMVVDRYRGIRIGGDVQAAEEGGTSAWGNPEKGCHKKQQ